MRRYASLILLSVIVSTHAAVAAESPLDPFASDAEIVFHDEVEVNDDDTGTFTETLDRTIQRTGDIAGAGQVSYVFDPEHQTFKLLQGWVDTTDGVRLNVAPESVMVRPSHAASSAPGFVSTMTATIVLPQITVGAKVHLRVERKTVRAFEATGFNTSFYLSPVRTGDFYVAVHVSKDKPLSIGARNGFTVVRDESLEDRRFIEAEAHLRNVSPEDQEVHMPPLDDIVPLFTLSTLKDYADLGRRYHALADGKDAVTPEIQALADQVAGSQTGLAAARALYNWVGGHIRYLAVDLSDEAGYIPHPASAVLAAGYGDCKDQVVLLQALLKAKGIASEPVIVKWSEAQLDWPAPETGAFNHMIIYLPEFDLYANPTDTFTPFGVLDYGLVGKPALHATATPVMRRIPSLKPQDAQFSTTGTIAIAEDGSLSGTARVSMTPMLGVYLRRELSTDKQQITVMRNAAAHLPQPATGNLQVTKPDDLETPFSFSMTWRAPQAVKPAGFVLPAMPDFSPNPSPQSYLGSSKPRRFGAFFGPKTLNWRLTLTAPAGQNFTTVPADVHVTNETGSYDAHYENAGGSLTITRTLVLKQWVVPAAGYGAVEAIFRAIVADQGAIVSIARTNKT
ncbi:DUF3857 domain-containing protein [Rhizobium straminoryzae]|uniref:DUF3857 domain-containing protein n=1 Tax=Rhizobium straminoryzae TaxID=1387186 RepID=A0A549TIW2_9HYPH|nr:DUF3857 domain-containing protein [Rhizobium straminoryzae]TRL43475.1 DUF3857 domain-containing protein [Rhizobium straminoryzae]